MMRNYLVVYVLSMLICGYILFDSKGNALLIDSICVPLKLCQTLYRELIGIVHSKIKAILSTSPPIIYLRGYYVYLGEHEGYILAVIADDEDTRIFLGIKNALARIASTGYRPEQVFRETVVMGRIKKIIMHSLSVLLPSTKRLLIIADRILKERSISERHMSLDIPSLHLRQDRISGVGLAKEGRKGAIDLESLIMMYMKGDFRSVIDHGLDLFHLGDLPKILFSISAINIMGSETRSQKISAGMIKSVIMEIEDDILRDYLMAVLDSYIIPVSNDTLVALIYKAKRKLLDRIENTNRESSLIYSLVVMDIPIRDVQGYLLRKFLEISELMSTRILSMIYTLEIQVCNPPEFEVWQKYLQKAYDGLKESLNRGGEIPFHRLFIVQMLIIWALYIHGMNAKHIYKLLDKFISNEYKYYKILNRKSRHVPNAIKVKNVDLTFNILLAILMDISEHDKVLRLVDHYRDILLATLKWLVLLRFKRSINTILYQTAVSRIIGLLSMMFSIRGIYVEDIPKLVKEHANYCMDMYSNYDNLTYATIYLGMAEALAYMAVLYHEETKREILRCIYDSLKPFVKVIQEESLIKALLLVKMVKILKMIGTNEAIIEAKKLIMEHEEGLSTFFRD